MLKTGLKSLFLVVLMAVVWGGAPLAAQDAPTPKGHWDGVIEVPDQPLEFNVDLMEESGSWSGDISIPAQETADFPLGGIVVVGNQVTFRMEGIPGSPSFTGILSEDGQTITGTFNPAGQSFRFTLTRGE